MIEQRRQQADRRRAAEIAQRQLGGPGEHRIGEDQRPPAAAHPIVEGYQLRRLERPGLGKKQQPTRPKASLVQQIERPDSELALQHPIGAGRRARVQRPELMPCERKRAHQHELGLPLDRALAYPAEHDRLIGAEAERKDEEQQNGDSARRGSPTAEEASRKLHDQIHQQDEDRSRK
jgi:hypothetical protein